MAGIVLTCLKLLLKADDSAARLDRAVSKLVAAPFATASSQLTIAMRLEPTDGSKETLVEAQYRNERYKNALVSFDMARSLATEDETMVIDLCPGLICTRLPGASAEAALHREFSAGLRDTA
jgi:hypothetical protein